MPVGDVALDWLGRWLGGPAGRAPGAAATSRRSRGGPLFLGDRGRRLARQQAWAAVKRRGRAAGLGGPRQPAHAAPLVRDAPARGRRRPAHRPGVARTCEYHHDAALHAPDRRADPGRLRSGPSAGLRGRHGTDELRGHAALDGRADHPSREAALVRLRVGRPLHDPRGRPRGRSCSGSAGPRPDGITGRPPVRPRLGRRRDRSSRGLVGPRLDDAALPQPGVRHHQPAGHPGRGRPQQALGRQLAREDQRRGPDAVGLRPDVRLRRPRRPDRGRESASTQFRMLRGPIDVQEGDARREARARGRHGAPELAAAPAAQAGGARSVHRRGRRPTRARP